MGVKREPPFNKEESPRSQQPLLGRLLLSCVNCWALKTLEKIMRFPTTEWILCSLWRILLCLLCFCSTKKWIQGFTAARQVLYYWVTPSDPVIFNMPASRKIWDLIIAFNNFIRIGQTMTLSGHFALDSLGQYMDKYKKERDMNFGPRGSWDSCLGREHSH